MDGEAFGLDSGRARALGVACGDVGSAAAELADDLGSLLLSARQPMRAAHLLREIEQELSGLCRVIIGTVDAAEAADDWLTGPAAVLRHLVVGVAERALWKSLDDDSGARSRDHGVFELADSFRTMGVVEWHLAMTPPGCGSFGAGRYYSGGGAMRGPDGRLYPLVVPHLAVDDEHHYTIDADAAPNAPTAASLGGADSGWTMVAYRTGVERLFSEPSMTEEVLVGLAVGTGLDIGAAIPDRQLAGVHLRAGRRASFLGAIPEGTPVDMSGAAALESPAPMVWLVVDGRAGQYPIDELADQGVAVSDLVSVPPARQTSLGRLNTAENALALMIGAISGFVAARDLDEGRHRAYEVMFEEHADGRLRARVQTFTLEQGPNGAALYGWHLFVDEHGDLRQSPVSYLAGPALSAPSTLLAHNPMDPTFTSRLPGAAIAVTTD